MTTAAPLTVCIAGGTGFIGGHLSAALTAAGDSTVRRLTRRDDARDQGAAGPLDVRGDLLDGQAVRRFVTAGSVVVNLAYAGGASAEVNRTMASNLADACLAAPAARVVHCSTAVVVGRPDGDVVDETVPCRPVTPYQASKLEIEQLLGDRLGGRCPLTVVRPTAVFGSGGRNLRPLIDALTGRPRLINVAAAMLLADRRLHLVSVENVVAAIRFILGREQEPDGEVFIVSDDEAGENNRRAVMDIAARELGMRPLPPWRLPFSQAIAEHALRLAGRADPNPRRIYSSRKLRERGFSPPLEFAEGVRRFARDYAAASRRP